MKIEFEALDFSLMCACVLPIARIVCVYVCVCVCVFHTQ